MAERIITTRCDVALEWMGLMGEVSEDHRSMDESGSVDDIVSISEETTLDELADDTGAFD